MSDTRCAELELDAARYQRLRVLGCAPMDTKQLASGTVMRFTNLDEFVDSDLRVVPSRGEPAVPAVPTVEEFMHKVNSEAYAPAVPDKAAQPEHSFHYGRCIHCQKELTKGDIYCTSQSPAEPQAGAQVPQITPNLYLDEPEMVEALRSKGYIVAEPQAGAQPEPITTSLRESHKSTKSPIDSAAPTCKVCNVCQRCLNEPCCCELQAGAQVPQGNIDVFEVYGKSARRKGWDFLVCKSLSEALAIIEDDLDSLDQDGMDEVIYE
jgi:hypothetical protein